MYNPTVSIVMTTYNAERYLHKQLDSIVEQTYKHIKLLVLDDCSEDNTWQILKEYQRQYDFINIIQNTSRLGVIKNFEKGIATVDGELIALCDHDDIWVPSKLELQVNIIKMYRTPVLVHTDLEVIDNKDMSIHKSFFDFKGYNFPSYKALDIIISRSGIMGNTLMFNRALKEIILPFPNNIPMHDYYIGVINEIYGTRITLNEALVRYRIHELNVSNRHKSIIERIKGFFSNGLPYIDRKDFLLALYKKDIDIEDKLILNNFLKCIEYKNLLVFIKCLNENYFKDKIGYKFRLLLRYIIE